MFDDGTVITIFWDITSCSRLKVNRPFGRICRLYLQSLRISRARNQRRNNHCLPLAFTLISVGLFFDLENGGDMFLRKVSWLSTDFKALYPGEIYLHNHYCKSLNHTWSTSTYLDYDVGTMEHMFWRIQKLRWSIWIKGHFYVTFEDMCHTFLSINRGKIAPLQRHTAIP
jgi:hypothetical protein